MAEPKFRYKDMSSFKSYKRSNPPEGINTITCYITGSHGVCDLHTRIGQQVALRQKYQYPQEGHRKQACTRLTQQRSSSILLTDIRDILRQGDDISGGMSRLRELSELVTERGKDIRTSSCRTKDDFESSSLRDDESARLVVIGIAVRIWAHFLCLRRIVTR